MRKSKAGLYLMIFSGFLVAVGSVFLMIAFHQWVHVQYPNESAAFITAGGIFGLAIVLAVAAWVLQHQRQIKAEMFKTRIKHDLKAAMDTFDGEMGDHVRENPITAVLLAGLAGYIAAETVL